METGHFSYLTGRTARMVAIAKSRGMSESALARLPKIPHIVEPLMDLKPVLATKRDAQNLTNQAVQIELARKRREGVLPPIARNPRPIPWLRDPERHNRLQRGRAIIEMVAREGGIEGYQVRNGTSHRRFVLPRMVAVHFLFTLAKIPGCVIAEMLDYEDVSTPRNMAHRARARLARGNPEVTELHDHALAAIKARWPEYAQ